MPNQLTTRQDAELDSALPPIRVRPENYYANKSCRILRAYTDGQMESLLHDAMGEGWMPSGSATFNFFRRSTGQIQVIYLQTCVRIRPKQDAT